MTISNEEIEKLIYDEAYHNYPELYSGRAPFMPCQKSDIDDARLLQAVYGCFDALPSFLTEHTLCPPPRPAALSGQVYPPFDIVKIRKDFPILKETVNGHPLIWFDNAATTQKPECVIDRLTYFYAHENSNVHRAAHALARRTTEAYEDARRTIAGFIGAPTPDEIVFTRGTTESINLVAASYGVGHVTENDEILISALEHHANIVPWQFLCQKTGARLKVIPVDDSGQLLLTEYERLLTPRTRIVALTHVSNVLGTVTPAGEMIRLAHSAGARVLVDGAQAAAHLPVDVTSLDADFYVFSGHKLFGPTGIGVLYGKAELLEEMAPYQGGGNMISDVTMERSLFKKPPHKFEAGTGNIAGAIGLGCAALYVTRIGLSHISRYENDLLLYAMDRIGHIPGITVVGNTAGKSGIISFYIKDYDSDELAALLDHAGIAVRAGHHCAQPVLRRFKLEKILRASFALYNTVEEIDAFISELKRITHH